MARTFKDDVRDDVKNTFLDVGHFADMITYIPKGGLAKEIAAIVTSLQGGPENAQYSRNDLRKNSFAIYDGDNTTGHVNPRQGDIIEYTEGGIVARWGFEKILKHDVGLWTLEFTTGKSIQGGINKPNGM